MKEVPDEIEEVLNDLDLYVGPEPHWVAFRTAGGRTGDVEVLVNWNVARDQDDHCNKEDFIPHFRRGRLGQ